MDIGTMLSSLLSKMPPWVKITTFFALLVVAIYLMLAPRIITTQVVAETGRGGFVPYRGANVQTELMGHNIRFKTNEYGYVSMPLVNRLPAGLRFQIYHEDDKAWHEVSISAKSIWLDSLRVRVNKEPPLFSIVAEAGESRYVDVLKEFAHYVESFISPSANAEILLKQVGPAESAAHPLNTQGVSHELTQQLEEVIADVTGRSPDEINEMFTLSGAGGLSYVERIQVIEGLEQRFQIKIPDEHWMSIETAGGLADYTQSRLELEEVYPELSEFRDVSDWYQIQQVPRNAVPVFVPSSRR